MPRPVLEESRIHPAVRQAIAGLHEATLREVQEALAGNAVVVVGMAMNPFCRRARRALEGAGIAHRYLEYGSYFSQWRRRNAIKMWSGWPTLPMVFVKGMLVGGCDDLQKLIASGELQRLLA